MELRRTERVAKQAKVRLNWRDASGATHGAVARCVDVSETGLKVEMEKPIASGTMVQLESKELNMAGLAIARHSKAKGLKFSVGLQFSGGLAMKGALEDGDGE